MKYTYVIIPTANSHSLYLHTPPPFTVNGMVWSVLDDVQLGGYFYDHIRGDNGHIVGVRYWREDRSRRLVKNEVLRYFENDERFLFRANGSYVDILFEVTDVDAFKRGLYSLDADQSFGGDKALSGNGSYGLLFCFGEDEVLLPGNGRP